MRKGVYCICWILSFGVLMPTMGLAVPKIADPLKEIKRHVGIVDQLYREVTLTQSLAALAKVRFRQQEGRLSAADEALSQIRLKEQSLIEVWRKGFLALQAKQYQLSWQASLLMDLGTRRQDGRTLWVLEAMSTEMVKKIMANRDAQAKLEARKKQWYKSLVFFHEQQFNLSVKFRELDARFDLENQAISRVKLPKKLTKSMKRTWLKTKKVFRSLNKHLANLQQEKVNVETILMTHQQKWPLPVIAYASDQAFFRKPDTQAHGIWIKTIEYEPIAAIFAGTVQYIEEGEKGLAMQIVSEDGRTVIYRGLSNIFFEEGTQVHAHEIVAEASGESGWLYLEHQQSGKVVALDPSGFIGIQTL